MSVESVRNTIAGLLGFCDRPGVAEMAAAMDRGGFYTDPASGKYHGAYEGGLAAHSLAVATLLLRFNTELGLGLSFDTCVITGIGHDLCKMGRYVRIGSGFTYNKLNPAPYHGKTSLAMLEGYGIGLSGLETAMVLFHMGPWYTYETNQYGEYSLSEMVSTWNRYPAAKIIYFCDELSVSGH